MDVAGYLAEIKTLYASGQTTEHSFRPALAKLFGSIDPALTVINEPKHITDVGAPDFVFQRGDVAIGWCEAKDIGKDIKKFAAGDYSKGQKDRYRKGLPNLIYTNGFDFEFIVEGVAVDFITIADLIPTIPARPESFARLQARLIDFASITPLSVTSSKRLAELMAGKAALIKEIMGNALVADMKAKGDGATATDLIGQYEAFKANLISDITVADFADIYAETIAYGLFAARLHDETLDTFTRTEALDLLPKSNPFLRALFVYIAGPNLDERLRRVVDDLCAVFLAADMEKVLRHFGKVTKRQDPFLHFYETFLAEYNPAKRKARGVWYTPEPVVNFIVRAVDEVLKTEFGLADGLADTSRISVDWDTGQNDPKTGKPATIKKEVHRVQILDPATGTGTFLAEAVKLISERVKGIAPSQWSNYVENDLIPRIHGFELLMASYAMCHMKLDMILTGLGYKPNDKAPRLGVYLTNSLEEGERVEQTLFGLSRAIADEAKAASDIKRQTPIMCVMGNPPYSGISQNNGKWITGLIEDYKYVDGVHFGERKHWLQDDYVKFIRFAESMIEKNGEGVLGFITNHGYLDNPTFRGMRWHLLKTFDKIFVMNLHGNSNRKEVCPDGSPDKNVFDIKQGVSVIVATRKKVNHEKDHLAEVFHSDLWGQRKSKEQALNAQGLPGNNWTKIDLFHPYYFFVPFDAKHAVAYEVGASLGELFPVQSKGIITARDGLAVDFSESDLISKIETFIDPNTNDDETRRKFFGSKKNGKYKPGDTRGWKMSEARPALRNLSIHEHLIPMCYRPFDRRASFRGSELTDWPRNEVMDHVVGNSNLALSFNRRIEQERPFTDALVFDCAIQHHSLSIKEANDFAPLYRYPDLGADQADAFSSNDRTVNLDPKLYSEICEAAGIDPSDTDIVREMGSEFSATTEDSRPSEVKVFDYIYGVLHCPAYRETYAEFLKIDFPRVPFPSSPEMFRAISEQGEALRRLHLMEDTAIGDAPYPFDGDAPDGQASVVDKPRFEGDRVYINGKDDEGQYFDKVPEVSWGFYIGGYQPAQKWLKDRKGRTLSWDDIRHYQKIIKILFETDRIMRGIEMPIDVQEL